METARFDRIAATFAQSRTRRGALRLLGAAALGAGGLGLLNADEGEAKRRRRKKGKKGGKGKDRCLKAGDFCESDEQCCTEKSGRICAVASNAGNSDTTCCGGLGAKCGGVNEDFDALSPHCCAGFTCSTYEDPSGTPGVCLQVKSL